ncbi:hypothetical protein NBRC116602_19980 [Hyphomicrobiales bacterium 4NK60-0047b]|jgi:hypothetical protein
MKTNNENEGEAANAYSEVAQSKEAHPSEEKNDIEYTASLLKQLKMIADQSGHRMLYHLINMAEMEANSIVQLKEKNSVGEED